MSKKPGLFDVDDLIKQARKSFPELTRCVHCGELEGTERYVIYDGRGITLATYWLHPHCWEIKRPEYAEKVRRGEFEYAWPQGRPTMPHKI